MRFDSVGSPKLWKYGVKLPVNYNKLTQPERAKVREEYCRIQGNKCSYCNASLGSIAVGPAKTARIDWDLFPKGFVSNPIHLHHNHKTGMTIGAVHARCNAYLWQYHGE